MPNTDTTNTTTTNVARNVVEENNDNLPQLLDSRGGSHVTNVPAFDKDDFTSWKIRFLVFLDGLEPYLITTLEDGPFVPMSNLSTPANPLPKHQNQWSNAESRLANQDKRLKSIIIGCLPNDVMKSVIKYKSAKEMWTELCLAYKGPSDTRDTKIAALRLKFNAFKALEGEKVNGLIDDIYASETQRFTIQASSSKALISNNHFQDSDSDVEEDNKTSNEFMADLNAEYHERALLANQKKFYKRPERDCTSNKTSTPSYPSSNTSFNKPKPYTPSFTPNIPQNPSNHQKDYKGKYKGLKAEMVVLSQRIDELTKGKNDKGKGDKGKSNKGLIAESFDWDDEYVSLEDEGTTKFKAFMAIAEDEPSVGKGDARSGQWVEITMKKRKKLVNKFNALKQDLALHKSELCNLKNIVSINCSLQNKVIRVNLENESLKDEISDLKRVIEKWTCSKVTLDQLLSEQIPGNIIKALGGKGRRKENNSSKDVLFTKANVSTSESAPMITSDYEDDCDNQEPLPSLPKLTGAEPSGASKSLILLSDLTANMADLTLKTASKEIKKSSNKVSQTYVFKKKTEPKHPVVQISCPDKNALPSTEQLLLTLMEEVKCIKNQILIPSNTSSSVSQASSSKTPKKKDYLKRSVTQRDMAQLTVMESHSPRQIENLNDAKVKQLRSDNGTEFRNHTLEAFCDEKDHLGKFDEKADDGYFLGYSSVAKAFRVFNIRRQEMEETFYVTFSEDDKAISQTSTEGDAINFNKVNSFPDDEFRELRNLDTLCNANTEYFPYVPAFDRLSTNNHASPKPIIISSPLISSIPEDSSNPNIKKAILALDEVVHPESAVVSESTDLQEDDRDEPSIDDQPLLQINSPLADSVSGPLVPQGRWSREKHIKLVNIIGEPLAGITTRSRIRDSDATSASKCLYVNFLLEIEPKKLIEALEEEG
ncbi:retrovirus-related pol polyprotein from transposon TNT 1-94 [Tanacetum coccineum]